MKISGFSTVTLSRRVMVAPHPPHVFAENGKMYTPAVINEEMTVKAIKEEELNGGC